MKTRIKENVNGRFYVEITNNNNQVFKTMSFKSENKAKEYGNEFLNAFSERAKIDKPLADKENEALHIPVVSNCKTDTKLNRLEIELGELQKVHGEIIRHFEVNNSCDSFKFKDGAVYRVKIERNLTKATLD